MEKDARYPVVINAKKVAQCKLCKLEDTDPDLTNWIYELKFDCHLSLDAVVERVNKRLVEYREEVGRKIPDINSMNLSVHFRNHVPVEVAREFNTQVRLRLALEGTQIANASDASKDRVQKALNEAEELNLFVELLTIYKGYKKDHEKALEKTKDGGEASESKESFDRTDRMIRMLVELNRMRQGDKLIGVIIKTLMKYYSHGMMIASLGILERLKLDLAVYIDDPHKRDEVVNKVKRDLGEAFVNEAEKSLKNIRDNYPVPVLH